jgi:long-subunit fatty acid transport protein
MKIKLIAILLATGYAMQAQVVEDAIRMIGFNGNITARAGVLGVSNHGISDDASAIFYNPAGLFLARKGELNIGAGLSNNVMNTQYLGTSSSFSETNPFFSNIAIVAPVKENNEGFVFGLGYFRETNFSQITNYEGFNRGFSKQEISVGANTDDNIRLDSLYQNGFVNESGGINNITGAMGFQLNKNFLLGASLIGKFGSYNYYRELGEFDRLNRYNAASNYNVDELREIVSYQQGISGFALSVGAMALVGDVARISAKIQSPTFYGITESFSQENYVLTDPVNGFRNKIGADANNDINTQNYSITTPWVLSAGASINLLNSLTLAIGVDYADAAQTSFSSDESGVNFAQLNNQILRDLRGYVRWGASAEYKIPLLNFFVLAGYEKQTSPYKEVLNRVESISFGLGYVFDESVRVDANVRSTQFDGSYYVYEVGDRRYDYTYSFNPVQFGLGITYRY